MKHTPTPWTFEASTQTIRAKVPNYWILSMTRLDGAVDNQANAEFIVRAVNAHGHLLQFAKMMANGGLDSGASHEEIEIEARAAIANSGRTNPTEQVKPKTIVSESLSQHVAEYLQDKIAPTLPEEIAELVLELAKAATGEDMADALRAAIAKAEDKQMFTGALR